MQRIAPNNQYEPTYYIEVWRAGKGIPTMYFLNHMDYFSEQISYKTICVFKIRPNQIPTKHNFNK